MNLGCKFNDRFIPYDWGLGLDRFGSSEICKKKQISVEGLKLVYYPKKTLEDDINVMS